jgi:hypothetical protein
VLPRGRSDGGAHVAAFVRKGQRLPGQNVVAAWLLCEPSKRAGARACRASPTIATLANVERAVGRSSGSICVLSPRRDTARRFVFKS